MPPQVLGIALEDNHVDVVRLTGHGKAYDVKLALRQPLPMHEDEEEQAAQQREALQRLVETHELRGDTVVASLPAHRGILRNLALPFRDVRRIRQTIGFALDEHIPFEPEDVVVDFRPLPAQRAPQQTQVLVAGMPKQAVAGGLALLRSAGLEPGVIDLDVFSLASAAVLGGTGIPGRTALLYADAGRALLTLMQDGVPVFARSLVQGAPAEGGAAPDPERLGKQLQHTLYACENTLQRAYEPDLLLLFGPHPTQLAQWAVGLQESSGVPARVWELEAAGYRTSGNGVEGHDTASHAIALGAALRGLHRQHRGFNLRRGEFAPHSNLRELRGRLVALGVLAVVVGGLGLGNLSVQNHFKAQRLTQARDAIADVFSEVLPGARMVQPVAQVREQLRGLDRRLQVFGGLTGSRLSALQILREVSARVPASLRLEVDSLTINGDAIELSASASSYDNIVTLQGALAASPLLDDVSIHNTRQGPNNTVQFRLSLRAANGLQEGAS